MIKRLTINLLIIFMIFMGVIYGYTQSFSLSKFDRFSYAEADNWSSCDSSDLVTAFRYYCKSRNLALKGSVADALTGFTTTTFNNICSTLGIDPTTLSAELKKTTEGNLGLRFLFSRTGITAYNRIFAEFLQNNDLAVGDEVDDKVIHSGEYYIDPDGHGCFVWNLPGENHYYNNLLPITWGSTYLYDGEGIKSLYDSGVHTLSLNYYNQGSLNSYSRTIYKINDFSNFSNVYALTNGTSSGSYIAQYCHFLFDNQTFNSDLIIFHVNGGNTFYFGNLLDFRSNTNSNYTSNVRWANFLSFDNVGGQIEDANISITTNNNTINNNSYNNNWTIIYNDGDTYINNDDPEPPVDTQPGGGGGDPGGDPDPTPTGPSLPDWQPPSGTGTIGSDGTFDFDIPFSLPNLNIDWSLKDIGHKFPFCIPGDIVSFYQTLAVEPRAPSIDAHIPLGSFYDWHFVADFSQYDRWAVIIRAVEYVGFVIGLIYFTVRMVKG